MKVYPPRRAVKGYEEAFHSILDEAPYGIVLIDGEGRFLYANGEFARITGYFLDEVPTGRDLFLKIYPDVEYRRSVINYWKQDEEQGKVMQREFTIVDKKGMRRDVEIRTAFMSDGNSVAMFKDISQRREVERTLEESEERHRLLVRQSSDGIYTFDPATGSIQEANASLLSMLGYSLEEIAGMTIYELIGQDRESIDGNTQKVLREGAVVKGERCYRRKDGSLLDVEISATVVRFRKAETIMVNVRDITERKRMERALVQAERKYRGIFENALDGIFQTTPEGRYISANPTLARIFGYDSPDEMMESVTDIGRQLYVNPGDREKYTRWLLDHDESLNYEVCCRRKDGAEIWASINSRAVRGEDGKLLYFEGIFKDITPQKRAEEALRESQERYRNLVENIGDAIWEVDQNQRFTYASPRMKDMLGYEPEELLGRPVSTFIQAGQGATENGAAGHMGATGGPGYIMTRILHKSGRTVEMETSGAPFFDSEGNHLGYRGVGRDVTLRRQLETELQRANKLESVGTLAGGIAHDFNNILMTILGHISLARMHAGQEEKRTMSLEKAETSCLRAQELTQRLITFSKGGAPRRKAMAIPPAVMDAARFASRNANVECLYSFPEGLLPVFADEGQIRQVVQNIVRNAVEAMPGGGRIMVKAENVEVTAGAGESTLTTGTYVKVSVSDEGTGIPPDNLTKIFDPYFTTKDMGPQRGMGLGLAVCYSIIKSHGGAIQVESKVNEGAAFSILLPAYEGSVEGEQRP
jgi:PAS domain S-box-containing protein